MASGKARAAAAAAAAPVDSSDEEVEQRSKHVRQPKDTFSKKAIHDAVFGTAASAVQSHVPSFLTQSVAEDWGSWLKSTPETLAEVPPGARPLPMLMPMKCRPREAEEQEVRPTAEQVDLMTYRNPDGSGSLSAGERNYDARQVKVLLEGFVDIDSFVIVQRPDVHEAQLAGFRTPFYLGKVLRVHYREPAGCSELSSDTASSTSTQTKRVIEALDVHWCYPFFQGRPCDDVRRPWKLGCCAMHEWDKKCETRLACKETRRPELGDTSREWSHVPAQSIMEMGVKMTPSTNALSAAAREKIAMHSDAWAAALGVEAEKKSRKPRARKQ
jgi:hypothetical protein